MNKPCLIGAAALIAILKLVLKTVMHEPISFGSARGTHFPFSGSGALADGTNA